MERVLVVAGCLTKSRLDIADVCDLRPHMKVHELEPFQFAGFFEKTDELQDLATVKAKLRLFPATVLPFASADTGKSDSDAELRFNAEVGCLGKDDAKLREFLDDDEDIEAQGATDQRQPNIGTILVAIANHGPGI